MSKITPLSAPVGARLEERAIEALKGLRGFDMNLGVEEAEKLYELNIQRLAKEFAVVVEACAEIAEHELEEYWWAGKVSSAIRVLADPLAARLGRHLENLDEKVAAVEGTR